MFVVQWLIPQCKAQIVRQIIDQKMYKIITKRKAERGQNATELLVLVVLPSVGAGDADADVEA
jgi:hypothetical protein